MKQFLTALYILLILVPFAHAQKGKIEGRIYNAVNNEPLPFSNILITGTGTGSTSDFEGKFIITGIDPGFYSLTVSSLGFETVITEEIQVNTNKPAYIDVPMRESDITLNEVQVTAKRFRKTEESPVSLRTLGASEIENSPGANRDISRVIQNLPGVAALPGQPRNDIIVRGGASNESRFYLDDVEIPYINHFSTQGASGGTNGILNADFIREVEFYSGAFPVSRGNALSGIFNFMQKDGNSEKLKFRGSLGASETSLTLDGPAGENTSYIVSVRRSYLQFLFKAIGLPFLPTFNDYQLKVKTRINDRNEFKLISIGALDQFRLDTKLKNPTEYQQYILNYLPVYEQWSYAIGGVYKHYRDNGYNTLVLSRNMLNNRIYKFNNNDDSDASKLQLDYISQETENKLRFESYLRTPGDWKFIFGAGAEQAGYSNDTYRKIFTPMGEDSITYISVLEFYKWNVFAQGSKAFFSKRLVLSMGIRTDAATFSAKTGNPVDQLSPRFSASYILTDKLNLNFNTGRYYQLPTYTTLGYRDNRNVLVNKENGIRYIEADHLVAGFEYLPDKMSKLSLEGFYKQYRYYPFSVADSISLAHKMIDFGTLGDEEVLPVSEGRAYGLEFLLQSRLKNDLNLVVSYTYAISEFLDKNGDYRPTGWDNRHIFIATITKKFKKNWYAGLKWRYAGGLPYTPYDLEQSELTTAWDLKGQPYMDYDRLNSMRFNAFHQLDFRVDKSYYFKKSSLKIYFDVQNAYNFKSEEQARITNLDEAGKPVFNPAGNDRYMLREIPSEGNGTILPTLGIIVDF
ncbi:MAG: TonB-dependent receptor [Bacteroidota bacterium]